MTNPYCSNALRQAGQAYPRTCRTCGLGPCSDPSQVSGQKTTIEIPKNASGITVHNAAQAYRLAIDTDGGLILQGAFTWNDGNSGGIEWRKVQTVVLLEKSQ